MKNQKGFIPVIIILVVLIGFGAFYFLGTLKPSKIVESPTLTPVASAQPSSIATVKPVVTSDPTANWKTYTNTKFNYQVKHPNVWNVERGPGNISDSQLAMSRNIALSGPSTPPPGVAFNIDTNELDAEGQTKNCISLEDCINKISAGFPTYDSKQAEIEAIKFLGQDSKTITYTRITDSYKQKWVHQFVIVDGNLYHFSFYSAEVDYSTYRPTFDQILSTFKFTN